MHRSLVSVFILAASGCLATTAADAAQLIAMRTLQGSGAGADADLSGLSGALRKGVARNLLGGLGSGFAWAGGNPFLATPDRGPNAIQYDPLILAITPDGKTLVGIMKAPLLQDTHNVVRIVTIDIAMGARRPSSSSISSRPARG